MTELDEVNGVGVVVPGIVGAIIGGRESQESRFLNVNNHYK